MWLSHHGLTSGESSLWDDDFDLGTVPQRARAKPTSLVFIFYCNYSCTDCATVLLRWVQPVHRDSLSIHSHCLCRVPPPSLFHTTFSPASGNVLPTFPVLPSPLLSQFSSRVWLPQLYGSHFWRLQIYCNHTHLVCVTFTAAHVRPCHHTELLV